MLRYLSLFIVIVLIAGCTAAPVANISKERIPSMRNGEQPPIAEVERGILAGAAGRGWSARVVEPGLIEATIAVRKHEATVDIPYTQEFYSINYKSSYGLDYDGGDIHRNYNRWVVNLSHAIQQQLGSRIHEL